MKKLTLIGAAALSVSLLTTAYAEQYDKSNFSLPSTWKAAYEPYGYNIEFKQDFLDAVDGKDSRKIYHLGYGTVVCNSDKSLSEFVSRSSKYAGFTGSSRYPGCFYMFGTNSVGYVADEKQDGHINVKFIMTDQPAWRNNFYDNKVGDFSVMEGYTTRNLMHAQTFDEFVKSDEQRWDAKQDKIRWSNNMPDANGNYPDKYKGDKS